MARKSVMVVAMWPCSFLIFAIACMVVASTSVEQPGECTSAGAVDSPDMHQTPGEGDLYLLQTSLDMHKVEKDDEREKMITKAEMDTTGSVILSQNLSQVDALLQRESLAGNHTVDPMTKIKDAVKDKLSKEEETEASAAAATGVTENAEGDLEIFIVAVVTNVVTILVCIGFFLVARSFYSDVYEWNLTHNLCPDVQVSPGWLDWARRSLKLTTNQVQDSAGLDMAMLLEFTHLGMKIMGWIGVPMICIIGPMNWAFGENRAKEDHLSYLSFGNVVDGSWLYWVHSICVWGVVFCVQVHVYRAMNLFMTHRTRWLRELPEIQANTIMVQEIPEDRQSDTALKAFFEDIFGARKVKFAKMVKICPDLSAMAEKKETLKLALGRAQRTEAKGKTPEQSSKEIEGEIAIVDEELKIGKKQVLANTVNTGYPNSSTGFVTFTDRNDAEIAASALYSHDVDEYVVSMPPPSSSLLWDNLEVTSGKKAGKLIIGYGLVAGLYFLYLPLVIWITQIANSIDMGPLQPLWGAFAPTLGLQFMVAFLPTFLILIFQFCFSFPSSVEAQAELQNWYFVFQVVFVVLVTAIGPSLWDIMLAIAQHPFEVFEILATTMPFATHFYMNFLVLQWTAHFTNFTRSVNLFKYVLLLRLYEPPQAKELSEPEDQDYYGIGSRSARFTINLVIGIVYGTLSPPINALCFVNFAICRLVYGYVICFAENKKPDLGGRFWYHQLLHVFIGNIIYCVVMTGVLLGRSESQGPGIIAACSLGYVLWSFSRFKGLFSWERLTLTEVVHEKRTPKTSKADDASYEQPVFLA